jgi:Flp pilus assembly protein TadG
MVEFALVMPMLILFIMGTVDFGRALFTYAQASSQLRQALRLAAVIGYDTSATATYRDCDLMRAVGRNVFFAQQPIPTTIEYYIAPTSWNTGTNNWASLNDWTGSDFANPDTCAETSGADVGPTGLKNGDILRITINPSIKMITPVFPQTLTFTLTGQRTIVNSIKLTSLPRCGDKICQTGETSVTCAADCTSSTGSTILITNPGPGTILAANTDQVVTISVSPSSAVEFSTDNGATWASVNGGAACSPCQYTWHTPLPASATQYTIKARTAGTGGIVSGGVTVTVSPNTAPTVNSATPSGGAIVPASSSQPIAVNITDIEQLTSTLTVAITVNGVALPAGTWASSSVHTDTYTANWTTPSSGSAVIGVTVTDSGPLSTYYSTNVIVGSCGGNCQPFATVSCPSGGCVNKQGTVSVPINTSDSDAGQTHTVQIAMVLQSAPISCTSGSYVGTWTSVAGPGVAPGAFSYSWNTLASANGTYTVCAKATDNSGAGNASFIATQTISVTNPTSYHLASLTATVTNAGNSWDTMATVVVMRDDGQPMPNATVTLNLIHYANHAAAVSNTGGTSITWTCTTDSAGQCYATTGVAGYISDNRASVRWLVATITASTLTYNSAANTTSSGVSGSYIIVDMP